MELMSRVQILYEAVSVSVDANSLGMYPSKTTPPGFNVGGDRCWLFDPKYVGLSHWVPHSFGLVPHWSKELWKLPKYVGLFFFFFFFFYLVDGAFNLSDLTPVVETLLINWIILLHLLDNRKKNTVKVLNHFFITATNFNDPLMALMHIGSDYFPWLLLSKFPLL